MTSSSAVVVLFMWLLPLVLTTLLPLHSDEVDPCHDLIPGCHSNLTTCHDMGHLCRMTCRLCFVEYEDVSRPPVEYTYEEVNHPAPIVAKSSESYGDSRSRVGASYDAGHRQEDGHEPLLTYGTVDQFKPVVYSEMRMTAVDDGYDFMYNRRQNIFDIGQVDGLHLSDFITPEGPVRGNKSPEDLYQQRMLPLKEMQAFQFLVDQYEHLSADSNRTPAERKQDEENINNIIQFYEAKDDKKKLEMVYKLFENTLSDAGDQGAFYRNLDHQLNFVEQNSDITASPGKWTA